MLAQLILDSKSSAKDSELRSRLAAATFKQGFRAYKQLAEWLDCYAYILPEDRKLLNVELWIDDTAYAYAVWEFLCTAQSCLTLHEQELAWKLIKES